MQKGESTGSFEKFPGREGVIEPPMAAFQGKLLCPETACQVVDRQTIGVEEGVCLVRPDSKVCRLSTESQMVDWLSVLYK